MSVAMASTSRPMRNSLRELLERVPRTLNAQEPGAMDFEARASAEAMEAMGRAEARLLKSADTFFQPLFRVSVLDNLGRNDPFAEPGDEDFPDEEPVEDLDAERRRVGEIADRAVSEQPPLRVAATRVQEQAAHLQRRVEELTLRAQAVPSCTGTATTASSSSGSGEGAEPAIMDTVYAPGGEEEKARETDILHKEEELRSREEELAAMEMRKTSLAKEEATRRANLARERREIELLEREQQAAAAALIAEGSGLDSDIGRRAEASRETENLVGVSGMSETQLEACVRQEESLVDKNSEIRDWYATTVAMLTLVGGIRLSHRPIFGDGGRGGGGGVAEGMELMMDLGAEQTLEITVSSSNGGLSSVQLLHGQRNAPAPARVAAETPGARKGEWGGISPSELEELKLAADAFPAPQNLRVLVREALNRSRRAAVREEHVRIMRRRYLTSYSHHTRELTVTMPAGIVACIRLHEDYPEVAGGAQLVKLAGVGGWNSEETEEICRRVNHLASPTLKETVDALEAATAAAY